MKTNYKIPFDPDGDMMNCVSPREEPEWRDNCEFEAQLTVLELHHRGAMVEMVDSADTVFWLSTREFMRLVRSYTLWKGKLPSLWWTFRKVGHSYYIYEVRLDSEVKASIDAMSQLEMARMHRFAPLGDPMFQKATGAYFARVFEEKGGMTTAISKAIGWGDGAVNNTGYNSDMCLAVVGTYPEEYRCGKPATHETQSVFWTTVLVSERLSETHRTHQPVCETHARQVDTFYKQAPDEHCTLIKRG